jgi:hypothetical protein
MTNIAGITQFLGRTLRKGDGERKTLLTRQIAFELLPASVLFGLVGLRVIFCMFKIRSSCPVVRPDLPPKAETNADDRCRN